MGLLGRPGDGMPGCFHLLHQPTVWFTF